MKPNKYIKLSNVYFSLSYFTVKEKNVLNV